MASAGPGRGARQFRTPRPRRPDAWPRWPDRHSAGRRPPWPTPGRPGQGRLQLSQNRRKRGRGGLVGGGTVPMTARGHGGPAARGMVGGTGRRHGAVSGVIRPVRLRQASAGARLQHQLPPFVRRLPGQNLAGWTMLEVFDTAAARDALAAASCAARTAAVRAGPGTFGPRAGRRAADGAPGPCPVHRSHPRRARRRPAAAPRPHCRPGRPGAGRPGAGRRRPQGECQKDCAGGDRQERFRRPQGVAWTVGRSR